MRIGIIANLSGGDTPSLDTLIEQIATRARERFATVWMAHIRGEDTLITLALAGRNAPDVELGTAVIPIYTRHPLLMAQQALTTQAAVGGRLALGLGLSHKPVVEDNWGLSFERPVEYMQEYLAVLMPLLRGEAVNFSGQHFKVNAELSVPGSPPAPPVLLAALGTRMLRLCGEQTDGTITWMVGPRTLESHIAPILHAAASEAGRPARGLWSDCRCASPTTWMRRVLERPETSPATAPCPHIGRCWIAKASRGLTRWPSSVPRPPCASGWRPSIRPAPPTFTRPCSAQPTSGRAHMACCGRWHLMDDSRRSNRPTPRTSASMEAELRRRVRTELTQARVEANGELTDAALANAIRAPSGRRWAGISRARSTRATPR